MNDTVTLVAEYSVIKRYGMREKCGFLGIYIVRRSLLICLKTRWIPLLESYFIWITVADRSSLYTTLGIIGNDQELLL